MMSMTNTRALGSITFFNIGLMQESLFIITILYSFCLSTKLQRGILFLQKVIVFTMPRVRIFLMLVVATLLILVKYMYISCLNAST